MSKGSLEFDYIFEPREEQILEILLPLHVRTQVWRAMLESSAAEHAARMNAMENATDNAAELIESLTLHMNKVRQDSITRQIIEVVSGADALKG
jgi:F-type H+-transporting ATPase subunit gamma